LPRGEQAAVSLCDRRGGQRLRIQADERAFAEVLEQHGLDLGEGNGRNRVDQMPDLVDVDVRQEIRPR